MARITRAPAANGASNMTANLDSPPRVLEPFELWFGVPIKVAANMVIVSAAAIPLFGLGLAVLLCAAGLLMMFAIHRNNPHAVRSWWRVNPIGYRDGRYRAKRVIVI